MVQRKSKSSNILKISGGALMVGLWVVAQACAPSRTTRPKAPQEAYSVTKMEVQNDKFLSIVNIPVSIALSDIEQQINSQVSGLIYEDNSLTDNDSDNFLAKVWKRKAIRVHVQDSLFYFQVPLKIWVKAGVKILGFTQFQETDFEFDLKFVTRFSINPDWTINTQTTAAGYEWKTKPTITLGGFSVPITGLVERLIDKNLGKISKALDQQVQKQVDLKTSVLNAWNSIRQPRILSEKYRTWLLVAPKRVLITPFYSANNRIHSTIGIEGYTLTQTGDKPEIKPVLALPELVVTDRMPDDFRIGLLSEVTYPEAARLAAEEFVGKSFEFRNGRYRIAITEIDLYGQYDNLIIKAGLKGSINGTIYLRGRPYYDSESRTVSLRDLKYDLDTRNVLQRTAGWLLQGSFARILEKQLAISVGEQLDEAKNTLRSLLMNNQLTRGIVINGKVDQIMPDQVYLTKESLLAVVYAQGKVDLKVDGLH